jgi:hypothetical protein
MADRYWVGGTASWDGTAGTKWATTSGGTGGETVPTTADDVFFDAGSTGTVTISTGNTGAKSINCTGFTGTFAGTANITIAGSLTLAAGMGYTYTGDYTFTGTGTLITAGKTVRGITVNPGVGNTITLGDAFSSGSTLNAISVANGAFDTANYAVSTGRLIASSGNATVNLGSSTVTLNGTTTLIITSSSTFNAGTSQINITVNTATSLTFGGKTYYNVSFTNASRPEILMGTTGATFNNLSFIGPTSSGVQIVTLGANITVNGTLTAAGPTVLRRMFIRSDNPVTIRTITAANVSADDCDFESITIAGAASPIAPARAGDCGGNSGITFPAAKTVYRVGLSTVWASGSAWAPDSGGTGNDVNFPLAQDTAAIDNNTALTGTLSVSNIFNVGAFDCSNRTTGITINYSAACRWHGSHTLSSAITVSGAATQTFAGRAAIDFTSAGKTITFAMTVANPTGTFRLMDALNGSTSSCAIIVNNGTFNANNYNVTCFQFVSSGSTTRTVTMGSGLWTIGGTSLLWNTGTTTNLTFNKDTADILLSNATTTSRIFTAGALSFNKLTIGGTTGTSVTTLGQGTGASFTELASTKTVSHTIRFSANVATIGVWSVTGTAGNVVTVDSNTAGTRRTFTLSNITSGIDYLSVIDIGELSGNKFYVGTNSTNGGNNSNVYFTDPPAPTADTGNMLMLF